MWKGYSGEYDKNDLCPQNTDNSLMGCILQQMQLQQIVSFMIGKAEHAKQGL